MLRRTGVLLLALGAAVGCASGALDDGAKSANAATAGGVTNQSGGAFDVASLHDPLAEAFLHGSASPPKDFASAMSTLAAADPKSTCTTRIALVSERAQLLDKPDGFRAVFIRDCGTDRMFLSPEASVSAGDPLPTDVEMLAFDKTTGVFNFYSIEGGDLRFMGNSIDMLSGPGKGEGGTQERRCANCHAGGGPVMKELILPWANWDGPTGLHFNGGMTSPGSADVFTQLTTALKLPAAFHATGDVLENAVEQGLKAWNATRLTHLATKETPELLRPLFCTVEVNLQTAPDRNGAFALYDSDFFVNSGQFNVFTSKSIVGSPSAYASATASHQQVLDASGNQLTGAGGKKLVDTRFAFNHPFSSFADNNYIDQLKAVTSPDLVAAVVGVDFTTPVFSDRRCGLLQLVPTIPADLAHPAAFSKALIDGLTANLTAAPHADGTPEAELLANLADPSRPADRVTKYLNACAARATDANFALDTLKVESVRRAKFRQLAIFEHVELLPVDDLKSPDTLRFDPDDCTLK